MSRGFAAAHCPGLAPTSCIQKGNSTRPPRVVIIIAHLLPATSMADPSSSFPSSPSADPSTADIKHPPRKRASGPRFDALPEFRAEHQPATPLPSPYPADAAERVASVKEPRIGPFFVRYSVWGGGAAIAYTYLVGFRALYQKDRFTWMNTFRQRVFIMSPLITLYLAGANLLPLPFKQSFERALGRPAISLMDINAAEKKLKDEQKAAQRTAQQERDAAFTDRLAAQHSGKR